MLNAGCFPAERGRGGSPELPDGDSGRTATAAEAGQPGADEQEPHAAGFVVFAPDLPGPGGRADAPAAAVATPHLAETRETDRMDMLAHGRNELRAATIPPPKSAARPSAVEVRPARSIALVDMWATGSRAEIVDRCTRIWEHSDATIAALDIDAPGHVSWWPRPDVKLFNILVHVLNETNRHAGHADIVREQLDGAVGTHAGVQGLHGRDTTFWKNRRAKIERAANVASTRTGERR